MLVRHRTHSRHGSTPFLSHTDKLCYNLYGNIVCALIVSILGGYPVSFMQNRFLQLFVLLLIVCVPTICAQQPGGTLSGTITSPSGAAVANAAVTVTNTSTNAAQRVLTAPDGTFTIS